jgi:predicted PurR-regulated permease PerM
MPATGTGYGPHAVAEATDDLDSRDIDEAVKDPVPTATLTATQRAAVPWRTIWACIGAVLLTFLLLLLIRELSRIILWLIMASFLAAVLTPGVDLLHHRFKVKRGLAIALVLIVGLLMLAGLLTAFIVPLARQGANLADDLPGYVEDAQAGRGAIGRLIERYDLQQYLEDNQERIEEFLSGLGSRSLGVLRGIFAGVVALLTIFVLTVFMVASGPRLTRRAVMLLPEQHRERARTVGGRSARAVSGYVFGNFVISIVAGLSTWLVLVLLGVPYAGVLALWVAFADLIPMVGATLGAIPTIAFSFLHSTQAGIIALLFYIAYQQFENHVLQPVIMARSVAVSPLAVFVAVLCGIELAGFAGALLAVPAAGIIQVVVSDIYDWRRGELKVPVSGTGAKAKEAERRRVRAMFLTRWSGSAGDRDGEQSAAPADATRSE